MSSQTLITTRMKRDNGDSLIIRQPSRANQQAAMIYGALNFKQTKPGMRKKAVVPIREMLKMYQTAYKIVTSIRLASWVNKHKGISKFAAKIIYFHDKNNIYENILGLQTTFGKRLFYNMLIISYIQILLRLKYARFRPFGG
jgi:hypothetical protein